jgi:MFS family permease
MKVQIEMKESERLSQLFGTYRRCLFIGCMLQFFQQFVGINTIMYYGPDIIKSTGISIDGIDSKRLSIMLNIPLAAVNAIGSVVAIFVIDNMGRRFIMLRLIPGILCSLLLVSFAEYLSNFCGDGSDTQTSQ